MPIIVPKQKEGDAAAPNNNGGDDQGASSAASPAPAGESNKSPTPSVARRYNTILRDFMAYHNGTTMYPEDHTFTEEELLEITPDHIIRFFTMKLYGDGDATPSEKPKKGSHHTLDYYKKAISSFMPLKEKPWDIASKSGNPTRSKAVNNFIRRICDLEQEESSKKRKETPVLNYGLPLSTAKKARVQPTASSSSNEIVASILQKMQLQNSLTIDFLNNMGNSIFSYRNTLQANNQTITAELQLLNNSLQTSNVSVPPMPVARLPTAAAAPVLPPVAAASVPAATAPVQQKSWFYNHPDGSTRRVPPTWKFPSGTLLELYTLWHLGDPENCISPMKTFSTSDVSFCGKRSRMSLSEARCLANALDAEAIKAGKSIPPNMSQAELVDIFRVAVNGLDMPLQTPTGRQRDIFRLKWSTFTKYKVTSKDGTTNETTNESPEAKQLTYDLAQVDPDGGHWLYEHPDGKRRRVPSSWTFPMVGLQDIYVLWNCSNDQQQIVPMKNFTSKDVNFLKKGSKNLAEVRGLMKIISEEAASKGFEIKEVMTVPEALCAFEAGVGALKIPLLTPQGKARDVARTKWSSASRFKKVPTETAKSEAVNAEEAAC